MTQSIFFFGVDTKCAAGPARKTILEDVCVCFPVVASAQVKYSNTMLGDNKKISVLTFPFVFRVILFSR